MLTDAEPESTRAHARLTRILDSITDPFTVLDHDLRFVHVNESAARLLGKRPIELLGRKVWDVVPEAEDTEFGRAYMQVMTTRKEVSIEAHFAPWDRWYESSIYPLEDGIAVYSRDVTMRKHAMEMTTRLARHAALRAEISAVLAEERDLPRMLGRSCESLVEHLEVAFARVWTVDQAGTTLLLQASAGMYTHLDGPHRAVPVGSFKIGRIAANRTPHLTNDVPHDPEIGDPAWAAREKMVAFAGYPLIVDGRVIGVFAMFAREVIHEDTLAALASIADVLAQGIVRRTTEIELELRMQDLARSNADLEQFAYVASHDLQEPLRMVASYNQLLARRYKGKLGEDADEFIGYTVEGVTRMQRLINDLLAYSRVGTRGGRQDVVDVEAVLADALANLQTSIAEHAAVVTHDPLPKVTGDQGQLIQVFQNLVGNAVKFHGDEPPRVHIGYEQTRRGPTFSVQDNGIGIDPQYFERIFVLFQRLNARVDYPGTGIGLSISKKIVERHGGRIWVESAPGKGAKILFTLAESPRSAS
ncbi:MAG: PAS domain-containing protein [Deltaproteobacteria bacterium]|nr:PAS domain-containing protein [Deltaproteobacteria bacterium]